MTLQTLADRLDAGSGRLCTLWTLTRRDGRAYRYTDHDRPLVVAGQVYACVPGLGSWQIAQSCDLEADLLTLDGPVSLSDLSPQDLAVGLFDGARLQIELVDWAAPDLRGLVFVGNLGRVRHAQAAFEAQAQSLKAAFGRELAQRIARVCSARLGDGACGVDLSDPAHAGKTCDQRFATCVGVFANGLNFRGFPFVPGPDALIRGPVDGQVHDGGSAWR